MRCQSHKSTAFLGVIPVLKGHITFIIPELTLPPSLPVWDLCFLTCKLRGQTFLRTLWLLEAACFGAGWADSEQRAFGRLQCRGLRVAKAAPKHSRSGTVGGRLELVGKPRTANPTDLPLAPGWAGPSQLRPLPARTPGGSDGRFSAEAFPRGTALIEEATGKGGRQRRAGGGRDEGPTQQEASSE